jgi:hypothetical protein
VRRRREARRRGDHGGDDRAFLDLDVADRMVCERYLRPTLRNWNGIEVGQLWTTEALRAE